MPQFEIIDLSDETLLDYMAATLGMVQMTGPSGIPCKILHLVLLEKMPKELMVAILTLMYDCNMLGHEGKPPNCHCVARKKSEWIKPSELNLMDALQKPGKAEIQ